MNLWRDVRQFVLNENGSKREACRRFNISWDTMEKMLKYSSPPGYRMQAERPKPKIGPYMPIIDEILMSDRKAPPKQKHTAKRIWERLQAEYGFEGGYTIVKDAVREWRRVNDRHAYVPLSHPPGEAQVDYGFATVVISGEEIKAALFVMSLPYSDIFFVKAYPRECTETFQDGHVSAFEYFGGVPTRISYDNSRVAVRKFIGPRERELTDGFLQLQSHHLYDAHFCLVRKANEKGHVENLVSYARNNFLVPVPSANSFEELNQMIRERCEGEYQRSIRGKDGNKAERLEDDQAAFLPLPSERFEARRVEMRLANSLSLIRFDRNSYSVPVSHAHHSLSVVGTVDEVRIMNEDTCVAVHKRDWSKENTHFNPVHYLALLERRPGALDFARPLENWELPSSFHLLRRRLEGDFGNTGTRHYIQVLRLLETASLKEVDKAVTQALALGTLHADAVKVILTGQKEKPIGLFCLDGRPHLKQVRADAPDLKSYGKLLHQGGEA